MKDSIISSDDNNSDSIGIQSFSRNERKYRRIKNRVNKKKFSFDDSEINNNKAVNLNEMLGPDSNIINIIMPTDKDKDKDKENEKAFLINDNKKGEKIEKEHLKFGRKKKNSSETGKHNKYSGDNLIRKCKGIILHALYLLINSIIEENYKNEPNYNKKLKKLLKINQFQIINSDVNYNKSFLKKKVKDIFSEDVTMRCSRYSSDHNKKLIKSLLAERDEKKKKIFTKIFELTFLECLEHFRGTKCIKELNNLTKYEEVCKGFEQDEDYLYSFKYYIDNYETIMENKKPREKTKKKKNSK